MSHLRKDDWVLDPRLNLPLWDTIDDAERLELARAVEARFPEFHFEAIEECSQGSQRHRVAFFSHSGSRFALIPGGEATIGYDSENPWVPSDYEREEWDLGGAAEKYGPLQAYIVEFLSPLRQVRFRPFLLEVEPRRVGEQSLDPNDPEVDHELVERLIAGVGGIYKSGIDYRLDWDGTLITRKEWSVSHAEACALVSSDGFRLPTSDEWEYACGAGSRSFFRWGDHVPPEMFSCPVEPPSQAEKDAALEAGTYVALLGEWLAQTHAARAEMENPAEVENAFGLLLADPDARQEYCHEPGVLRGSDGGRAACGGFDSFTAVWLQRATSFVFSVPEREQHHGSTRMNVRRCFPID